MQLNLRKQTLVSYEYKKDSLKRDKIMRNLKTSVLAEIGNLTSINPPNWQNCSRKLFWSSLWGTRKLQLKGLCLVDFLFEKVILLNIAPYWKICINSITKIIRDLLLSINPNNNLAELA